MDTVVISSTRQVLEIPHCGPNIVFPPIKKTRTMTKGFCLFVRLITAADHYLAQNYDHVQKNSTFSVILL